MYINKSISKILSKSLYLLNIDEELNRIFTPGLMVSLGSSRKLSSYLLRGKLYPTEIVAGSFK